MSRNNHHSCPVCNQAEKIFHMCRVEHYEIYGCESCGAEHVYPMPDDNELKAYYDREQWFQGGERGGYENYDHQTSSSVELIRPILEEVGTGPEISILDVGCGYGTHLELAADLKWKCFGVELSNHAREIARKRLGNRAYIVENVEELIPHEFDVVLILDVIEHLVDPYLLFYSLFSIGAITQKTRIIISTPNADSDQAKENPVDWPYRHPPSHLVYYKAKALLHLLSKLHFSKVDVTGIHPLSESSSNELSLSNFGGLLVNASGSDFAEFMRERYVPGTWSKIAEYEHLPRYEFAKRFAINKVVLDFGCGTGYGSAMLAGVASKVTGLDIDEPAIGWAKSAHRNSSLSFLRSDDFGANLPSAEFDLITCFEMIEHVDYKSQIATIKSIARMLKDNGIFIISTPNPAVTALYGDNPYHLREMTKAEFNDLLSIEFPYVKIINQSVRNSISFDIDSEENAKFDVLGGGEAHIPPLAYIAFCSKQVLPNLSSLVVFDNTVDVIKDFMKQQQRMHSIRYESYSQREVNERQAQDLLSQLEAYERQAHDLQSQLSSLQRAQLAREKELVSLKFLLKKLAAALVNLVR